MNSPALRSCRIAAVGAYRPAQTDSREVAAAFGEDREWVLSRTGVETRCVATPAESVAHMALAAAQQALENARMVPDSIDAVVVATSTNPQPCPSIAPQVASVLGLNVAAFDVNIACAGFCYALQVAGSLIAGGSCTNILVIGADRMLDMVDPDDKATAPVFADGAGAVVVTAAQGLSDVGPVVWGSAGEKASALQVRPDVLGAARFPATSRPALRMDGLAVARWACSTVPDVVREILSVTEIGWDDVAAFVPHQANWKLIQRVVKALEVPEKVVVADDVRFTGNTSSASVPLALHRLIETGRVRSGEWAVLVGFGAGLAYAGQAVRIP
ncbi:beta-ketoacyl-acyl-carrier-protein synthase I [Streptomyces noursei ATCC 11455]|uniref:ketoacyl-ACP synthase III n=1 Tax=Streptomyces noursei TaxID=1971 RepID=UPI00081C743D|nr:beta-ketoacyl-acyl-carrier-protein synthase I [Streptomyces noursei ATCC 11455]